ncbi:hypothetical protein HDV06_004604 [Boothiomyces sp. JEL0866]|nr:hypothetical protein HDV06_004604 [Boothiomyces sp. JEL0866]
MFSLALLATIITSSAAINWNRDQNGDWASDCDFPGNDISSQNTAGPDCSAYCRSVSGCTQYAYFNGVCYAKYGGLGRNSAVYKQGVTCGINNPPTGNGGGLYGFSVDSYWNAMKSLNGGVDRSVAQAFYTQIQSHANLFPKPLHIAMLLAHIMQETSFTATREYCVQDNTCYNYPASTYQPWIGRGYMQITGKENYDRLQQFSGIDVTSSCGLDWGACDRVATDINVNWLSSMFVWSWSIVDSQVQQGYFGKSVQIQNGGFECGGGSNLQAGQHRLQYYHTALAALGLPGDQYGLQGCQ